MEHKNEVKVLKKLKEEYKFSLPISSIFNLKMPELTNAYHGISDLRISQDNYSSILETSITIG